MSQPRRPMTWANRLTLLRFLLALAVFLSLMARGHRAHRAAFLLFLAAILTDWVDGYIARRTHSVSPFGKVADPIADKILIVGALIGLLRAGVPIPLWGVFLIIARELLIGGIRILASSQGVLIAADRWGKLKMVIQSLCVLSMLGILLLAERAAGVPPWVWDLPYYLTTLCVIMAWQSAYVYMRHSRGMLQKTWG